jgi:hypothetical protein
MNNPDPVDRRKRKREGEPWDDLSIVQFLFDRCFDQFRFGIRQIVVLLPFHATVLKPDLE